MSFDLCLLNGNIIFSGQGVRSGTIGIKDGKIAAILAADQRPDSLRVIDCRDKWIFPGLIDPHTHIGFGDQENDWASETQAAALGGVTGLMSFWRSQELMQSTVDWRDEALKRSVIDFGFHFGITSQAHVAELAAATKTHGVTSIKVYLMYKGATGAAKGFTEVDDHLLFAALDTGSKVKGGVVGVHCENTEVIPFFRAPLQASRRDDLKVWDEQSPGFLETENVFRVAFFGEKANCPVNIVHMSAVESLDLVRRMRHRNRPPIHVETCIHYLTLPHDSDLGAIGKVNPPLRSQADIDGLWDGVAAGDISTIGSDHVPRKRSTKGPDIWQASAGFPGVGQILPVLLEEGFHKRDIPLERLAEVTSRNVAALYSLPNKGSVSPGYDADFAIIDPAKEMLIEVAQSPSFSDYSAYEGKRCRGAVTHTILRGQIIAENGDLVTASSPHGHYLHRAC
ncbi:MAG: amidohydrolase family protein [Alphaproteobacteria bacterium]|nr:amidohydrolase family protein [Alphaproteobacteria bacterium]